MPFFTFIVWAVFIIIFYNIIKSSRNNSGNGNPNGGNTRNNMPPNRPNIPGSAYSAPNRQAPQYNQNPYNQNLNNQNLNQLKERLTAKYGTPTQMQQPQRTQMQQPQRAQMQQPQRAQMQQSQQQPQRAQTRQPQNTAAKAPQRQPVKPIQNNTVAQSTKQPEVSSVKENPQKVSFLSLGDTSTLVLTDMPSSLLMGMVDYELPFGTIPDYETINTIPSNKDLAAPQGISPQKY